MSAYLQPQDYAAYGLTDATDAQISNASALIDGRIGRPDGLLWSADANGQPGWMTNKTASRSFTVTTATSPGLNTLTIPGGNFGFGDIGQAVLLDRSGTPEVCIVTAASGNTVMLTTQFPHSAGVTLEYGMAIQEDIESNRGMIRTSARPLANLLSVVGNYASNGLDAWTNRWNALATGQDYGSVVPLANCFLDGDTIRIYPGVAGCGYFASARVTYIAGWSYANLPSQIKQACANLVNNMAMLDEIPANIKTAKYGDATLTRFGSSLFDSDTDNLLMPYRTLRL